MKRREYLALCMTMPIEWLRKSAATPSVYMTRCDVALHLIAIRRKGG